MATRRGDRTIIDLRIPRNGWAEFVIYVPEPEHEEPFFIVPRSWLSRTTLQTADQLREYADVWNLLKRSSERKETQYPKGAERRMAESRSPEMIGSNI
jgi:hypothetical protein